jgi:alpha-beta hydrolase superfamily lysophospholipase
MRQIELTLDITAITPFAEPQHVCGTLFAPDVIDPAAPAELIVGLPGGGYSRNYYHPQFDAPPGYSFAEHFASRGRFVLALDHLGTGASSRPEPESGLSRPMIAEANHLLTQHALEGLADGRWFGTPLKGDIAVTGVGHSMGGMMVITQQGRFATFDRIVVAGWTNYELRIPGIDASRISEQVLPSGYTLTPRAMMRSFFYSADVPEALIVADEAVGTVASATMSRDATRAGSVRAEAEAISCPIFLFYGDNEVTDMPAREVGFFPAAGDITLFVLSDMAHIHNFERRRAEWWERLDRWITSLPAA